MEELSVVKRSPSSDSLTQSRKPILVVGAMVVAAFGPYLVGSIRTEQAAVYGFFILTIPAILTAFNPKGGLRFFVPWALLVVTATLGVVAPFNSMPYRTGSLLAGYDNILSPLVIMLVVWTLVPAQQARGLLVLVSKIVAVAMALNGLIALVATMVDLSSILRPFWGSGSTIETVAERAGTLGRSTGIFNQPAEAGALYGLAGAAAVFAWKDRPFFLTSILPLIVVGGLISVSKIFVLGGMPIIALYWFWVSLKGRNLIPFLGAILILVALMQSKIMAEWSGLSYLQRLFNTDEQNLLGLYGAGRFDEGSTFFQVVGSALSLSPLAGVGAAGWQVAYDGAIAEFLIIGGVLGLGLVFVVYISIFSLSLSPNIDIHLRIFAFLVSLSVAAASLGFSPLTANRVATINWILIALLVLVVRNFSVGSKRGPRSCYESPVDTSACPEK